MYPDSDGARQEGQAGRAVGGAVRCRTDAARQHGSFAKRERSENLKDWK
jgi:hypothetical protein